MGQLCVSLSIRTWGRNRARVVFATVALASILATQSDSVWANTNNWTSGIGGSWFTGGNWSLGVPAPGDDAFITNATSAIVQGATAATANSLTIQSGNVTVGNVSGGALTVGGEISVGALGSSASLTLNIGTISVNVLSVGANGAYSDTSSGTIILSGSSPTIQMAGNVNLVVNSQIQGSSGLIKSGLGTLTLAGNNTYSGGTTISLGTLQVGNGGTSGSLGDGDVTDNAVLVFNRSDGLVVSNSISGTGSLTQAGTGTLTLFGTNSYAGSTIISAGTLQVGNGGTSGTLGSGNVNDNSALVFDRSDTLVVSNTISGVGSLTQAGTGTLTVVGTNAYSGGTVVSAGTLQVGNGGTSGTLGSGNVNDNSALVFDRSDTLVVSNSVSGVGSLTQAGSGTLTIVGTNTYSGGTIISAGTLQVGNGGTSGTLGSGGISNDSALVFNRSDTLIVSNTISGVGSLTQAGAGRLTVVGTNTYSGGTIISAGTLQVGNGGTSGTLGSGGISNDSALVFNRSDTLVVSNIISGVGSLTQAGAGTLILAASNIYTGNTIISSGTLQVDNGGTSGSLGSGGVSNNSALVFDRSDSLLVSNTISGTGSLTQAGSGTLIVVGTNTYTGSTIVSAGTLQVGNGGTSGNLGSGGVSISNNSALVFDRSDTLTVSNAISGGGNLNQAGAGTLILVASNIYTGNTIISSGTLQVGNGGASGRLGSGGVSNDSALVFDRSDSLLVSNNISGTGSLTQAGTGTLTLTNVNTYSGGTWISNGGTLAVRNSQALGSGDLNLINGTLKANQMAINISGNYSQAADGTLEVDIGATNAFGQVNIAGTASLDGTVHVAQAGSYLPGPNDQFTLLIASNGVSGTFSTFTNDIAHGPLLTPKLVYGADDVILQWMQSSFVPFALTRNQKAVAKDLDLATTSTSTSAVALISFLDSLANTTNGLPAAFNLISPEELTAMYTAAFAGMDAQGNRFLKRANELRADYRGLYLEAYKRYGTDSGDAATPPADPNPAGSPSDIFAKTLDNPWSVYMDGGGEFVDVPGDANAKGYNLSSGDFSLGLDRHINKQLVVGGGMNYDGSTVGLTGNGHIDMDSYLGEIYAAWFTEGLHIEGMVGGGLNSYRTQRQGLQGLAKGNTDSLEWNALLGSGYDWHHGPWSYGPQLVLQYMSANIDAFTEKGSLAPLHIESQSADAFHTQLGADLRYRNYVSPTLTFITPELTIAWDHNYLPDSFALKSRLADGAGTAFTVHGPGLGSDSVLIGLGVTVQWKPSLSTYLRYTLQAASSGYEANSVDAGLQLNF